MTVQTVYDKNIGSRHAGLIYDMGNSNIDSFAAEEVIPYGVFVARGTANNQCEVGGAAAVGVAVRSQHENEYPADGAYDGGEYKVEQTVGVMREGYIWAQFDAAGGTIGDVVTINVDGQVVAAGGGTALTHVKARVEQVATEVSVGGDGATGVFVGLVAIGAA